MKKQRLLSPFLHAKQIVTIALLLIGAPLLLVGIAQLSLIAFAAPEGQEGTLFLPAVFHGDATTPPTTPPGPPPVDGELLLWSDPATWGGSVPGAGTAVTIPAGQSILLDVNPPNLASLTVDGTLVFDRRDIDLTVGWVMVHGRLQIGTADDPFLQHVTITLNGSKGEDVMGMGPRVFGAMAGGIIEIHGQPRTVWTKLNATANVGDTSLTLMESVDWQVGEEIVIASTDFESEQAERVRITAVSGNQITIDAPLAYMHWGQIETFDGHAVDQRAEVALLERNITIQSANDTDSDGIGGHLMLMGTSKLYIDSVALHRLGQRGEMGRYPIHFHLMGNGSNGSYITGSSIYDTFNRCLTIHGSNGVFVQNNVAYNAPGHCYFLEDGAEFNNVFDRNLGLHIYRPEDEDALLASDTAFLGPAVYWITNPANTFTNNVAAGSRGTGFWIALPEHPTGPSADNSIWLRRTPFTQFSGNVSHSNGNNGLHVDNGPDGSESGATETAYYHAKADPSNYDSATVEVIFADLLTYKNRNNGVWLRGRAHLLLNPIVADSSVGITFASDESFARNAVIVGETSNVGTPEPWQINNGQVGLDGRSLPRFWDADFPIRGFEFYDGLVGIEDSYLTGFIPNSQRMASALAYLDFTDFAINPDNFANNLTFGSGTQRVYLATRGIPADPTDGTEDGYRTAVFIDKDGSVSGTPNRAIVVDNPFVHTDSCTKRNEWNAWICDESYVSLTTRIDNPELNSVTVQRGGASHTMFGVGSAPGTVFRTMTLPRETVTLTFDDHIPNSFRVILQEGDGEWLRLQIPMGSTPTVDRYGRVLEPASSVAELNNATFSAYFYDAANDMLHVQIVASSDYEALTISR